MKSSLSRLAAVVLALSILPATARAHEDPTHATTQDAAGPKLENLLSAVLEGVDGTEVIVSRVTLPPQTMLPKHWHPGEEFAYVLEGTIVLWQKGKEEIVGKPGDVLVVPLRQIHTAMTRDEGATVVVFRVHKQGEPERNLVEDGER